MLAVANASAACLSLSDASYAIHMTLHSSNPASVMLRSKGVQLEVLLTLQLAIRHPARSLQLLPLAVCKPTQQTAAKAELCI
jgi:hypothetical protein